MKTKNFSKKKVIILVSILLLPSFFYLILSTGDYFYKPLPYIGPREAVPVVINGETRMDTIYHTIPEFSFIDQNGNTVTNEDFKGQIYIANFFFTRCPTICPQMAVHLAEIQKRFAHRDDFKIISHTVDPVHDSVEVLKAYAAKVHADERNWQFVTGTKEHLYEVAMNGYFAPASEDEAAAGGFLHSELLFLIDRNGHIRGTYDDIGNQKPAFDGTSTSEMKKMIDAIDNLYLEMYAPLKSKNNEQ